MLGYDEARGTPVFGAYVLAHRADARFEAVEWREPSVVERAVGALPPRRHWPALLPLIPSWAVADGSHVDELSGTANAVLLDARIRDEWRTLLGRLAALQRAHLEGLRVMSGVRYGRRHFDPFGQVWAQGAGVAWAVVWRTAEPYAAVGFAFDGSQTPQPAPCGGLRPLDHIGHLARLQLAPRLPPEKAQSVLHSTSPDAALLAALGCDRGDMQLNHPSIGDL